VHTLQAIRTIQWSQNDYIRLTDVSNMDLNRALSQTYESFDKYLFKLKNPVLVVLIVGLVLRLLLLPLTNVDSEDWYRIGENIISGDGFYSRSGYHYGPAFGYLLSLSIIVSTYLFPLGTFSQQSDAMIALQPYFSFSPALQTIEFLISFKLLMIMGDVLCAFLVRWIVFGLTEDRKSSDLAFALVFLSPIIFIESGVHGMFDIYCGLLSLLSVYFIVKRKYFFAGMSWSAATLIKIFPAYLFPVLVAMIFRQHKGDIKAIATNLIQAIAGFAIVFFMLYYPQLMDGTFMDTWEFLIGRVDNVESLVGKFSKYAWLMIPAVFAVIALFIFFRKHPVPIKKINLNAKNSVLIMCLIVLAVFAGLIVISGGITAMFSDIFHVSYVVGVGIQGFALIVAFYLGYKLYHSTLEDEMKLAVMVGTLAIAACFLWVPMPEYLIMILPLIVVYAVVYDRRYLTPYLLISFGSAFFIIMVEGPAALFVSVAQYTDLISIDLVIDLTEMYITGGVVIGDYSILQLLFCVIGAAAQLAGTVLLFVYRFRPYRKEEHRI